jgi:hypothetical protein
LIGICSEKSLFHYFFTFPFCVWFKDLSEELQACLKKGVELRFERWLLLCICSVDLLFSSLFLHLLTNTKVKSIFRPLFSQTRFATSRRCLFLCALATIYIYPPVTAFSQPFIYILFSSAGGFLCVKYMKNSQTDKFLSIHDCNPTRTHLYYMV